MPKGNKKIAKTATEALKIPWAEGWFKSWRTYSQIVAILAGRGNNFSSSELGMALMRAKYLTRTGKRGSYKYIQKYPYLSGGSAHVPKRRSK